MELTKRKSAERIPERIKRTRILTANAREKEEMEIFDVFEDKDGRRFLAVAERERPSENLSYASEERAREFILAYLYATKNRLYVNFSKGFPFFDPESVCLKLNSGSWLAEEILLD